MRRNKIFVRKIATLDIWEGGGLIVKITASGKDRYTVDRYRGDNTAKRI